MLQNAKLFAHRMLSAIRTQPCGIRPSEEESFFATARATYENFIRAEFQRCRETLAQSGSDSRSETPISPKQEGSKLVQAPELGYGNAPVSTRGRRSVKTRTWPYLDQAGGRRGGDTTDRSDSGSHHDGPSPFSLEPDGVPELDSILGQLLPDAYRDPLRTCPPEWLLSGDGKQDLTESTRSKLTTVDGESGWN